MLESLNFTGRELLVAVVLATVVYLFEVLIFSKKRRSRAQDESSERMRQIEEELLVLRRKVEALELRPHTETALDTEKSLHSEAARMARSGVPAEELADQLGISRTEADLIIAMHKAEP